VSCHFIRDSNTVDTLPTVNRRKNRLNVVSETNRLTPRMCRTLSSHLSPAGEYQAFYEAQIMQAMDAAVKSFFPARNPTGRRGFP
jgi:hypothetical protein